MKKNLILIAAVLAFCTASFAGGLNTYDGITYTNLLKQSKCAAGVAITGGVINATTLKGQATVIASVITGIDTNITTCGAVINVQDSSTGTGGWTNISGVSYSASTNVGATSVTKLDLSSVKNYLRAVLSATNDSAVGSAVIAGY